MNPASRLDKAKLAKVRALMEGGTTAGERAAAKDRATKLAAAAGLTLDEALSSLDAPRAPEQPVNFFHGFDDWMENREPGWKARQAAERNARETRRAARCAEILKQFGSEDAVFAETERERLLRIALEPLADRKCYFESAETYIDGYAGWTARKPPAPLMAAINAAYPLPSSLQAAWEEFLEWEAIDERRRAFYPEHDTPVWVRTRVAALESILDTMPAPTFEGVRLRLSWMEFVLARGWSRDAGEDEATLDALRLDFEMMMMDVSTGRHERDQPHERHHVRRTNAKKREDVLSILDAEPSLSDREIARRAGVSPQTVNTWRRKTAPRATCQQSSSAGGPNE